MKTKNELKREKTTENDNENLKHTETKAKNGTSWHTTPSINFLTIDFC